MTWCVRHAKQIPAWMRIYYIASLDTNIMGIILLLISIILTYVLSSFEQHPCDIWQSVLIIIQAVILFPSQLKPKRAIFRVFFAAGLLALTASTTIFLMFYYSFTLQPRYQRQIDTFDQIVGHNFLLAGDEHTKDYLMEQNWVNMPILSIS